MMPSYTIFGEGLSLIPKPVIYQYFSQYGAMSEHIVRHKPVKRSENSSKHPGFNISFKEQVVEEEDLLFRVHFLHGIQVHCQKRASPATLSQNKVFIKYLDKRATVEDVHESMKVFGEIADIRLAMKKNKHTNLGLCNISYYSSESIRLVMEAAAIYIRGKKVKIDVYDSPRPGPPTQVPCLPSPQAPYASLATRKGAWPTTPLPERPQRSSEKLSLPRPQLHSAVGFGPRPQASWVEADLRNKKVFKHCCSIELSIGEEKGECRLPQSQTAFSSTEAHERAQLTSLKPRKNSKEGVCEKADFPEEFASFSTKPTSSKYHQVRGCATSNDTLSPAGSETNSNFRLNINPICILSRGRCRGVSTVERSYLSSRPRAPPSVLN